MIYLTIIITRYKKEKRKKLRVGKREEERKRRRRKQKNAISKLTIEPFDRYLEAVLPGCDFGYRAEGGGPPFPEDHPLVLSAVIVALVGNISRILAP